MKLPSPTPIGREWKILRSSFLLDDGNLTNHDFDHSSLFKSFSFSFEKRSNGQNNALPDSHHPIKKTSVNIKHQVKSKSAWSVCIFNLDVMNLYKYSISTNFTNYQGPGKNMFSIGKNRILNYWEFWLQNFWALGNALGYIQYMQMENTKYPLRPPGPNLDKRPCSLSWKLHKALFCCKTLRTSLNKRAVKIILWWKYLFQTIWDTTLIF